MPNRVNKLIYREYTERYADSTVIVLVANRGVKASEAVEMRDLFRMENCRIHQVRNRIADIVFKNEFAVEGLSERLDGAMLFIDADEPAVAAKTAMKISKKIKALDITGVVLDKQIMGPETVKALSTMPTRLELIGIISGQAISPWRKVVAQALAPHALVAGQIKTIADRETEE